MKILPVLAALGIASSAYGLTIIPTWDSTITSDPNASAITNGIIQAISIEQSNVLDYVTVKIYFQEMSSGLGSSSTWLDEVSYGAYLGSLTTSATSVNDLKGLSKLPIGPGNPVTGNFYVYVPLPLARLLNFTTAYGSDGYDSTISLNTSIMNFTRPPGNASKYDIISTCNHEIDEVLGTGSAMPYITNGLIFPEDLFRYATNYTPNLVLTRTFTTNGDNAFFSVDGTNLLARFNMVSGGDLGDWWSYAGGHWAPPGVTPFEQVQDAFAYPDTTVNLGSNELTALDVIGWTITQPPVTMKFANSGNNQVTISWSSGYAYTLQQTTNLLSPNSWVNAPTGTANPAVLLTTNKVEFYRLSRSLPHVLKSNVQAGVALPVVQVTRTYQPGSP